MDVTQLILSLVTIIALAKLAEVFARRFDLPVIPIQLLIGVLLGPSVLDLLGTPIVLGTWGSVSETPLHGILKVLAEVGLIQLIFLSGLGTDWLTMKESWKANLSAGTKRFLIAALTTAGVGFGATGRPGGALAIGAIMAVTGFGVAFHTLGELELRHSVAGNRILGFAVAATFLGILLLIAGQATNYAMSYGLFRMIVAVSWLVGKLVMFFAVAYFLMSRYLNRIVRSGSEKWPRQALFGYLLLVAAIYGWGAMHFGSFAGMMVSGLGGILLGISSPAVKERLSRGFGFPLVAISVGVLFIVLGMEVNFQEVWDGKVFLPLLLFAALGGKAIGLWFIGKKEPASPREHVLMVIGSQPQGETGMVLAAYAFSRGLLTPPEFQVVIATVLILTFLTPFLMKIAAKAPFENANLKVKIL